MNYNINKETGTSLPHTHKNYEIIVYFEGCGYFHTEENKFFISAGKIVIVPPMCTHFSPDAHNSKRIYINGDFSHIFNITTPVIISDTQSKEGTALANMIYKNRYANQEYISALCNAFAHFLLQNLKSDSNISAIIKNISSEITENFHDSDIDLHNILEKSGYAIDYIRAQFKNFTGKTPVEFLTSTRISHARYLIDMYKDTLSLSEIAEKCGYTDYIYFSRRFRQVTGISPRKYKESLK